MTKTHWLVSGYILWRVISSYPPYHPNTEWLPERSFDSAQECRAFEQQATTLWHQQAEDVAKTGVRFVCFPDSFNPQSGATLPLK